MDQDRKPEFVLYFQATHWDREWYRTFQDFRFHLVRVFDEVIDVLEADPSFSTFIIDGQTAMLMDYLEAMPQNESRVKALVASGRLLIGPWYTMPDENLTSGESIIRNLATGNALTQKLSTGARVMPIGYVCDIFGHIAQLPQILNGCGIRTVILGRGTNRHMHPAFFRWNGSAGSACAVFKVPEEFGYGTFGLDVFLAAKGEASLQTERTIERAMQYIDGELSRTELPLAVLMDSMDHERIHPIAPWIAQQLEERLGCPVKIGQVDAFIEKLMSHWEEMPQIRGELQFSAKDMVEHNKLISNTLSSRYDVKCLNDQTQVQLEKMASPLLALAKLHGIPVPEALMETAYRYLLQNHAHDSICGCSIDEVHADMTYRFQQSMRISEGFCRTYLNARYALAAQPVSERSRDLKLTVFQYLPGEVHGIFKARIDFPLTYPNRIDEQVPWGAKNNFRIYDALGQEVPYQILEIQNQSYTEIADQLYPKKADRYHLLMQTTLPALAAAEFSIHPSVRPVRDYGSLRTGNLTAENGLIRIHIEPDGSVSLRDLKHGHEYSNLLRYFDDGETGDGWYHLSPKPDCVVHSAGAPVSIETTLDGPLACAFRLTHCLCLPEKMDYHRRYTKRSDSRTELRITTTLTILRDCPYVLAHIEVDNEVKDHRLVLSLASGIPSEEYELDQAFAFLKRPAGRSKLTEDWKEQEKTEKSFGNIIVRRRPDTSGFAFISKGGLHEAAVQTGAEGAIDVTLLRCFGKTFLTDGQPAGQMQGVFEFDAALYPFSAGMTNVQLLDVKERLQTDVFCYTRSMEQDEALPASQNTIALHTEGEIRISIIKPSAEGRTALRLVNYGSPGRCTVELKYSIRAAWTADLLENPLQAIPHELHEFSLSLDAGQIQTVLLELE
ncbi:MAG: glycoside hydrolase family 38 C-terminal domain-containing protein [Christensenella sp.]|nr:glycoside hydrolase family 38 C-terminal domain-containing protein [Christensenella sp.]